ncbi:MAG: NUDIX hydrolase [Maribacter sp.]|uniref:NUDIX hydrolase n=1 Tax=Maribacter sp. TaxID=1897614 RepID=UPI00329A1543
MQSKKQLDLVKRLKAIADTGLVYVQNDYDKERYTELRDISIKLMSELADQPLEALQQFFLPEKDYPTVKVDVRGLVLNEFDEILMAKERIDGKWTIPGGWADVGDSPSEAVLREIKEETGLETEVVRLLAIYDKRCHPHPPQPFYVYKIMFFCTMVGGDLRHGFDMEGAAFFSLDNLPELSTDRILESQLKQLFKLAKDKADVYFD